LSLASSELHPDLNGAFDVIKGGSSKARSRNQLDLPIFITHHDTLIAWLKDKINSKFVLPAIYQPYSLIPLDVWKAAPSTTNGNEQAH